MDKFLLQYGQGKTEDYGIDVIFSDVLKRGVYNANNITAKEKKT